MERVTKNQFAKSAIWKLVGTFAAKGVSLVISIILARILLPTDYGIVAIAVVFTNLSDILIDGGFTTALVSKKEVDKYDYSCVFITSLIISAVLYVAMYFSSPFFARYYDEPILEKLLRIIGLIFFIQAFSVTRNVAVQRNMQFKLHSICSLIASIVSGVIGIICAYSGLGVWSLVIQQLSQQAILTILLFVKIRVKLSFVFDRKRFFGIFRFSIGVMSATLINYVGGSLNSLFIGKVYSVEDLGYSDKGGQLPMQVSLYSFSSLSNVLLPTLASYQDDLDSFKIVIRKAIKMTAYIVFPMMIGMALLSKELIVVLLTDKWLPAVRIMQYSCIYYLATPFMLININAFYSLGHKYIRIRTEIIRIILIATGLFVGAYVFGCTINQLVLINAIIAVIVAIVTYFELKALIGYKITEAGMDLLKPGLITFMMGAIVFLIRYGLLRIGIESNLIIMAVCVVAGMLLYLLFSILLKVESYLELKEIVSKALKRKENE